MSDKILTNISEDGSARGYFIESTALVERARVIHTLSPVACAALGRTLSAASIMGVMLKDERCSLTLQFRGDGPIGPVVAVANYLGDVRGYVGNPAVLLPANDKGKFDVRRAIGEGSLVVSKDLGLKEPYVSRIPIVSGEIAEDITNYFAVSEQTPTICALGVMVEKETLAIRGAGGFIVQLMPFASDETIARLETNIGHIDPISRMVADGLSQKEIMDRVFDGIPYTKLSEKDVKYACDCTRGRVEKTLVSLGESDLSRIILEDEKAEVTCRFCDKIYHFTKSELLSLLKEAK